MNPQIQRKKTGLKIISVVMSILLWAYVVNQGSAAAGQDQAQVSLDYRNVPAGLTAKGPNQVTVRLWGVLEKSPQVNAYVDLTGYDAGTFEVAVQIEPGSGAILTRPQPRTVQITLAGQQEKVLAITPLVSNNPPEGYEMLDFSVTPEKCLVKGEESIIQKIDHIVAELDLRQTTDIGSQSVNLSARDVNGKLVGGSYALLPRQATVQVVVAPKQTTRELPVTVVSGGLMAPNVRISKLSVQPANVKVMGNIGLVDGLVDVKTEVLDLAGKSRSFQQELELRVPSGVSVFPGRVMVNVTIGETAEEQQ